MELGSLFNSVLIEGMYKPRAVAYYFKQWKQFQMSFHHHDATEIMYIISGVCRVEIEDGASISCETLRKGDFIVLDANVPHRLLVDEHSPCRMLNTEFKFREGSDESGSLLMKDLAARDESLNTLLTSSFSYIVLQDPEELYHVLKNLVLELDSTAVKEGLMIDLLFAQLLLRISRLWRERQKSGTESYVKQSMQFIGQNYDQEIQVKHIAAAVSLHPGYLQRIFKMHTGRTLMQVLNEVRMEKAKMLLIQTDIPVHEISEYVGISSRQYFHALFKKYTLTTPVEFRNTVDKSKWMS